jgi:hypothetical protein
MTYCGACGGFYSQDCPHRAGAQPGTGTVCTPAVNPFEQKVVEAQARIVAAHLLLAADVAMRENRTSSAATMLAAANKLTKFFEEGNKPDAETKAAE